MAPIRPSNVKRRELRDQCRERLSKHIQSRLGIEIKPSEVRLLPNATDPYEWKFLQGKANEQLLSRLFSKNLSDHSVNAYLQLCKGVGITFEAVPSSARGASGPDSVVSLHCPDISFTAKIDRLEAENTILEQELRELKAKAIGEAECRQIAEEKVHELYATHEKLQARLCDYETTLEYFRRVVVKSFHGLDKVLPILEELKAGVCLDNINRTRE